MQYTHAYMELFPRKFRGCFLDTAKSGGWFRVRVPRHALAAKFVVQSSYIHDPSGLSIGTGPHGACVVEVTFQTRWGAPVNRDHPQGPPGIYDCFSRRRPRASIPRAGKITTTSRPVMRGTGLRLSQSSRHNNCIHECSHVSKMYKNTPKV